MPTPRQQRAADQHLRERRARRSRARRLHSRDGCISSRYFAGRISRPIRNRNITTPSSATCRIASRVVEERQPERPDQQAGDEVAEHRAEAELAEHRHRDDGGRQQDDRMAQIDARRFRGHRASCAGVRPAGQELSSVALRRMSREVGAATTACTRSASSRRVPGSSSAPCGSIFTLKYAASYAVQRGVGISSTRA